MIEILNSYLILHKSISIPGLGTIYVERIPANTDFVNRQILPPSFQYRFDKYFDAPDKEFFTYLAAEKKIADFEAIKLYNEWAYEFRNRLKGDEPVLWEGVGRLHQDASGEIHFYPQKLARTALPAVAAERVVRSNASHAMLVGDRETTTQEMTEMLTDDSGSRRSRWWIYALVIAAVAAAILIYKFSRSGFTIESTGNSQKVGINY